jgi:hypothetical protein
MTKLVDICQIIESARDEYILKSHCKFSLFKYLSSENINRKQSQELFESICVHNIKNELEDINLALDGDKVSREAYGQFSKPELRSYSVFLENIICDIQKYIESKKITRKRKPTPPDKLVKNIKYLDSYNVSESNIIQSINPVQIPGCKVLIVYNTKYNQISVYYSNKMSIKGTTLKDFDVQKSWSKKIRNNLSVIDRLKICNQSLIEFIKDEITTNNIIPTGRINESCVLLRVL